MGSPWIHAESSVKHFGGKPEDYLPIHELLDSSKASMSDLRHRFLTHNSWFVTTILEKIFGSVITNSDGRKVSVREIGQWHVMEDFNGSFPSAQDFLANIGWQDWMDNGKNGARPPSHKGLPLPAVVELTPTESSEPSTQRIGIPMPEVEPFFQPRRFDFENRPCAHSGLMD